MTGTSVHAGSSLLPSLYYLPRCYNLMVSNVRSWQLLLGCVSYALNSAASTYFVVGLIAFERLGSSALIGCLATDPFRRRTNPIICHRCCCWCPMRRFLPVIALSMNDNAPNTVLDLAAVIQINAHPFHRIDCPLRWLFVWKIILKELPRKSWIAVLQYCNPCSFHQIQHPVHVVHSQ